MANRENAIRLLHRECFLSKDEVSAIYDFVYKSASAGDDIMSTCRDLITFCAQTQQSPNTVISLKTNRGIAPVYMDSSSSEPSGNMVEGMAWTNVELKIGGVTMATKPVSFIRTGNTSDDLQLDSPVI